MFMNRWLTWDDVVKWNELSPSEAAQVRLLVEPMPGKKREPERFLEGEVDEAIGQVRGRREESNADGSRRLASLGLRPQAGGGMSFSAAEGGQNVIATEPDSTNQANPILANPAWERIANGIERLIEVLVPKSADLVGTDYVASKLGVSKQWVGKMAEQGTIPKNCVAPKVSGGRIWKFHRDRIDAWLSGNR